MTEMVFHVTRRMFPQTYNGNVRSEYGTTDITMFLTDQVREAMGGEPAAFFIGDRAEDGKVTLHRRVPRPIGWIGTGS
jgi:hypothetical protein